MDDLEEPWRGPVNGPDRLEYPLENQDGDGGAGSVGANTSSIPAEMREPLPFTSPGLSPVLPPGYIKNVSFRFLPNARNTRRRVIPIIYSSEDEEEVLPEPPPPLHLQNGKRLDPCLSDTLMTDAPWTKSTSKQPQIWIKDIST